MIEFIKALASFICGGAIALALGLFFILVTIQVLAVLQWVGKI
jgi:Na+/pantothenate symporter